MAKALTTVPHPYKNHPPEKLMRLSLDVPEDDLKLISSICPDKGIKLRVGQILFHGFMAELRKLNIQYYSPENEQRFLELVRTRLPTSQPNQPTDDGDVAGSASHSDTETQGRVVKRPVTKKAAQRRNGGK